VYSWTYDSAECAVTSNATILVKGMALPGSLSATRAMAIPSGFADTILVFRGNMNDTDYDTLYPTGGK
jgi:hypothetical protein